MEWYVVMKACCPQILRAVFFPVYAEQQHGMADRAT